ncbi:MAG: pyridoxamine 5'-phosphate oxidase [Acidimicrobiales bacterium]
MRERWVPLDAHDVDPNPFIQFQRWFDEAEGEMAEREAVALATASREGAPSVRMVLLRWHDGATFGWYTNYESRKGDDLADNPRAALLWYCEPLGRQIRIEGPVETMSSAESDAYFASRARGSQIGARASYQSKPLLDRGELERRVKEITNEFEGLDVPRPHYWGGYRLTPTRFEFWQHRDSRLHDRVVYVPDGSSWRCERQSP